MPYNTYLAQISKPALTSMIKGLCILACSSLVAGGCSTANEPSATTSTLNEKIQSMHKELAEMTSNNYCETDLDCAVLSIGERACGGPSSYMIYSKQVGNEVINKLEKLSAESVNLAKENNGKSGLSSTCQMYPIPMPSCVENQCVTNEPSLPIY